jgi:hypothetical protein
MLQSAQIPEQPQVAEANPEKVLAISRGGTPPIRKGA